MFVPQPDGVDRPSAGTGITRPVAWRARADRWPADGPAPILPDWHELLAAFLGHVGDQPGDHPVTRWARTLAELHLQRRGDPLRSAEIDGRRGELVARIDRWVAAHTEARPRTRSLGAAIDTMAAAQVRAAHLLRNADDVREERVYAAWFLLASLADGWTELVHRLSGPQWPQPDRSAAGDAR
ncbi:hypothetical protein [Nocardia blacklockiae]|uniref:hypothetical protein n=1 Tax=Nocardia blacklockiae TaxID=480036 RepID=UPI0018955221|nr:hypothetical protein [Nocardia blacklockiae]MBF6172172.1 hypothetical protein [Nocardia blacklockiae]